MGGHARREHAVQPLGQLPAVASGRLPQKPVSGAARIYDLAVRELARGACGAGELDGAHVRVRKTNPMCGDELLLTLRMSERQRHISGLAHRTRGCLLCRASAALLAGLADKCSGDLEKLAGMRAALDAMLNGGEAAAGMEMFAPVASRPSRIQCVLLPWLALAEAAPGAGGRFRLTFSRIACQV